MSRSAVPRRLQRWIITWTALAWIVLELVTYPKDRPLSSGAANVLGGFFSRGVASYPGGLVLLAAVALATIALLQRRTREKDSRIPWVIAALAAVTFVWALAQMGFAQFDFNGRHSAYSWLFQTVDLLLVAALAWTWAAEYPERADLFVWNSREIWRLFRHSWQGVLGLSILIFFSAMALLAPFLVSHAWVGPTAQVSQTAFAPPDIHHYLLWLGSDEQGLSVWAEFVWSSRISLFVGLLATVITTIAGAGAGIFTGYYGGALGEVGMRIVDVFLVLPWLPLAMVLAAAWGQSYGIIILVIAFTSWAGTARVVRAGVLTVKELPYVERARAIGSSDGHIMRRHILPNVMPLIFANAVLTVAIAVFAETTLSFLGLGDPLNFSWGTMLQHVFDAGGTQVPTAQAYLLAPGIAVVLLVLAFNLMGTAFDEVLDPKLRRREEVRTERPLAVSGTVTRATAPGVEGVPGSQVVSARADDR